MSDEPEFRNNEDALILPAKGLPACLANLEFIARAFG